ncbi:hypothetical protein COCNU_scaffold014165G000010 [Cocos nucifera]|nr:hypothetical protein [Cocos nucifera]
MLPGPALRCTRVTATGSNAIVAPIATGPHRLCRHRSRCRRLRCYFPKEEDDRVALSSDLPRPPTSESCTFCLRAPPLTACGICLRMPCSATWSLETASMRRFVASKLGIGGQSPTTARSGRKKGGPAGLPKTFFLFFLNLPYLH